MKRLMAFTFIILTLFISTIYIMKNPSQGSTFTAPAVMPSYDITMKQDLLCLMLAYPEHIDSIVKTEGDKVYLVLKSGVKLIYDDQKVKNMEVKIASPDIQDMLEQPYPLTTTGKLMEKDFDPGRVRMYGLLKEVYGSNQQQIEKQLGNVKVGGRSFQFSKSNGAGDALKAAMEELIPLAQRNNKVASAAFPSSGTFNYRLISGTNRLSPHAFGIAIDLARDSRDYWQWAAREQGQKRLESYPKEIVEIFEKNNFVWGGKWGHFDILHFEYRPEIIMKARFFGEEARTGELWYKGAPEDSKTKEAIDKIEELFQ
ncbi:MAG TPA: M15 family metallopeptidase [Patescibacteria group bacterium]|nr:M15 family metallopeptidase [Patescibacteria group bacterium]